MLVVLDIYTLLYWLGIFCCVLATDILQYRLEILLYR
jgi:hypothetical protein